MSKKRFDTDALRNELANASLFFKRPTPTPEPKTAEPAQSPRHDVTTPVSHDVKKSRRREVVKSESHDATPFDINRKGVSHDTLRLSPDESQAIDRLLSAFKWDYDLNVSKNDVCRVALHLLLENYHTLGKQSEAVSRLRKKKTR